MDKDKSTFKDTCVSASLLALANMGDAFLYAYLPANHDHMGISSFWVGVILSVNRYTRLFLNGWVAWIVSTKGLKIILTSATILAALTTASYGWLTTIPLWILSRVIWGLSFSTLRLGNTLYALEHEQKGMALGLSRALTELGPVLALIAGPFILYYAGRDLTFLGFGIIGLAATFLVVLLHDLKTEDISKKDLSFSLPSSFNALVMVNAFITEGVLVVLLTRILHYEQTFYLANPLALAGLLLGYRRFSFVLFSTLSGWMADKWGFHNVFIGTTYLSAAGLLLILSGAVIPGIITTFTFSAMNASTAMGGALKPGNPFIKDVLASNTWRDIGMATGAMAGALALTFDDIDIPLLVTMLILLNAIGALYHRTKYEGILWTKERLFKMNLCRGFETKLTTMKTETISVLEKTQIKKEVKKATATNGCCGGAPVSNGDACCKLDEEKKAEGESGCGCNSTFNVQIGSGCC